jgi:HEAT repeat protein
MKRRSFRSLLVLSGWLFASVAIAVGAPLNVQLNPFNSQVEIFISRLKSGSENGRVDAAEALGYMRAYDACDALMSVMSDESVSIRREAAMSLAWCGDRRAVDVLLGALNDHDWVVAQAAWVSLNNLTGMEFEFDALAHKDVRRSQVTLWRTWWEGVKGNLPGKDIHGLLNSKNRQEQLRGVRALGALGLSEHTSMLIQIIEPLLEMKYEEAGAIGKDIVHSGIRSIGRLSEAQGFDFLMRLLNDEYRARYAADALADFGDKRAVSALIKVYPEYSRVLSNRMARPKKCPPDDRYTGDNTQDRMLETPFEISMALVRLGVDDPANVRALREITPYILANFPSDWDSGVFYEKEVDQILTAHLLDKAGITEEVCRIAFEAVKHNQNWLGKKKLGHVWVGNTVEEKIAQIARRSVGDVPDVGLWFPAFCNDKTFVAQLIELLTHDSGWIRINAAKALMFIGDDRAVGPIARLLTASKAEALWGFSGALEHAEYDDPAPRWREAFVRALGRLGAEQHDGMLISFLEDHRNVLDVRHAAAMALDELGTESAIEALKRADLEHPFHSVRMVAREAVWRRDVEPKLRNPPQVILSAKESLSEMPRNDVQMYVFIKGNNTVRSDFNGQAGVDPWRQTYSITNSGPAMRVGRNLYVLEKDEHGNRVRPLTHFKTGFVADCEVSWDGSKIIFARRLNNEERNYKQVRYDEPRLKSRLEPLVGGHDDPWWHIWQINPDGTGLKQLTFGPFHHVAPAYLPDGRIVLSSSRVGTRDEYHGYPCVGLSVMNNDGSDIHVIGFNLGSDRDPAVLNDGRIVFSRLDNFYSRLKTEVAVHTVFPDGTRNDSIYGPERRPFWHGQHVRKSAWTMRDGYQNNLDNRNRVLRLSQAQPFGDHRLVCATSAGLVIIGPGRYQETMVPHSAKYAVTSPYPLDDETLLCAATVKQFEMDGHVITADMPEFVKLKKGPDLFQAAVNIDLALYTMRTVTGEMTLLYNDPEAADFEARPIMARAKPPVLAEKATVREDAFVAKLFCNSARISRHQRVRDRGKFIRVIEGQPVVSRHETHNNRPTNRWKNHGGTLARVLGTAPLAADGSFHVEIPADRMLQLQILDSDRRVLGNQTFWMYARPDQTRSCVGCHETRDSTVVPTHFAVTAELTPIKMLPFTGQEFSYQAKAWMKGIIPDEVEERTRTVHAMQILGRR